MEQSPKQSPAEATALKQKLWSALRFGASRSVMSSADEQAILALWDRYVPASPAAVEPVADLIDRYWDIAYAEGKEGRAHDNPQGDAQAIRSAIDASLSQLSQERDELRANEVRLEELVDLLRDDVARFAEGGADRQCEGCGAPLADDEEIATTADMDGCWGYVSDVKNAPCFRYRTKKGADRSWPECAALSHSSSKGESRE